MLFYFDGQGNLLKVSSQPVYQGSNNAGVIYFIAPFDTSAFVTASFELPDGTDVEPIMLNYDGDIQGSVNPINAQNYSVWATSINSCLTAKTGVVFVYFTVTSPSQKVTMQRASFSVLQGTELVLPDMPTQTVYQSILQEIAYLKGEYQEFSTDQRFNNISTLEEKAGWSAKQEALTFDEVPMKNSANPVKSGGVYVELSKRILKADFPIFQNVLASNWVADDTEGGFSYRADLVLEGVTENTFAEVVFNGEQVASGNYSPICKTSLNTVSIFSKTNLAITIPTIVCRRVEA